MSRQVYVAAVSNADIDAVRTALAEVSGNWAAYLFGVPVIRDDDADDLDPPRGWAMETPIDWTERELTLFKNVIQDVAPASLKYREVPMKLLIAGLSEEETIDAWLATNDYRRRGVCMPSLGRALADGTADAQSTTTSYSLVDQWTTVDKMVRMSQQGQRFKLELAGTYELIVRLLYEPVQGVTFGFKAARNATTVGDELQTSDGDAQGRIEGTLAVDDLVGLAVRSSAPASLKLLAGSGIQLRRIAT